MKRVFIAFSLALFPSFASAHVGIGDTHGVVHGFSHPLSGVDHILAMVGVGMFAADLGGRAIWLVPLSFMMMMAVGGALAMLGVSVPFVEAGIGLSVVALGLTIAFAPRPPVFIAMAVAGFFALFHGHAHGVEMPRTASGLSYAIGFVTATGLLHLCGVGIGIALQAVVKAGLPRASKIIGGAIAFAGVGLLAGAF